MYELSHREEEIQAVKRNVVLPVNASALDKADHERAAIDALLHRKNTAYLDTRRVAEDYCGESPLNKGFKAFIDTFNARYKDLPVDVRARSLDRWEASYKAALLADVQAKIVQRVKAESEHLHAVFRDLHRVEHAQAVRNAEQMAAEEQARRDAEQKAAEEQALRLAQEAAMLASQAGSSKLGTVATAIDTVPADKAGITLNDITKALADSDIEKFLTKLKRFTPLGMLLHTTDVADGELKPGIIAAPLGSLGIAGEVDLKYLAHKRGTVDVAQRLQAADVTQWLTTGTQAPDAQVRVRAASLNTETDRLEFTRDGDSEPALVWTPMAPSSDSSSITSAIPMALPADPGNVITLSGPELYIYPEARTENIDDYVLVFPDHPGADPIYVVFTSPRFLPGVASGQGKSVTGTWLGEATRDEGVYVPSQVAEQLRGRKFMDFRQFRIAFWKAVGNSPALLSQFSPGNRVLIRKGSAPGVRGVDQEHGQTKFELPHEVKIQDGGTVYDVGNIRIITPKAHNVMTAINKLRRKP